MSSIHQKNRGRKSRDTAPLSHIVRLVDLRSILVECMYVCMYVILSVSAYCIFLYVTVLMSSSKAKAINIGNGFLQ